MSRFSAVFLVLLVACSEPRSDLDTYRFDGSITPNDVGVGDGGVDASMARDAGETDMESPDLGSDVDAGGGGTCGETSAARVNAQGILTNRPDVSWLLASSPLTPISATFVLTNDGGTRPFFELFIEVRNDGTRSYCDFVPAVELDGVDIIGLIDTPPHRDSDFDFNNDCLSPGDVGVMRGVSRDVTEANFGSGSLLSFDAGESTFSEGIPLTAQPTLQGERVEAVPDGGFGLVGTVLPHRSIYNYALLVYPRDSRGLLVDELQAYPNELETLPAGSRWDFATDGTECTFAMDRRFQSWIDSPTSGFLAGSPREPRAVDVRQLAVRERP